LHAALDDCKGLRDLARPNVARDPSLRTELSSSVIPSQEIADQANAVQRAPLD
jgi:hypothetical protein